MPNIREARILILATNGFEQSELTVPRDDLRKAGATVDVASPDGKAIRGWDQKDWGASVEVDRAIPDLDPAGYDALVLPGGVLNPDTLRTDAAALKVIRAFVESGKVVAAICHGPWLLVEVDAVRGRNVTSVASIRTDVVNAGGKWADKEVVTDKGIVTSRTPKDLPAFVAKIIEEVQEGRHERRMVA
ncbi:type 1 glutamine amidotransferase [Ancylobacter sp. 6x-1]|uniref:Type 1 glutamine amidotransferase n=1 Tax=Ancylobacter crimeensis TaxID=2579147 RepID=A0ABT0DDS6_9HYPH|nr:type 1 glutamine amidotransferase domain-containing protein [Ancylobacter crimeensis]MCK0198097.1 type 1 glutamine amidotransferase [Ancylobacter crimeensis]